MFDPLFNGWTQNGRTMLKNGVGSKLMGLIVVRLEKALDEDHFLGTGDVLNLSQALRHITEITAPEEPADDSNS